MKSGRNLGQEQEESEQLQRHDTSNNDHEMKMEMMLPSYYQIQKLQDCAAKLVHSSEVNISVL
ncbi:hypothetical protein RND71_006433 [Anisodus tanguticus]|uniref:Uncharacterized protein n=1 Tax=Anisodus tanguticus TaxID=243964 RepID=A0AAE1SW37_9SOLA|nr:hypothetical protein RND71_006433 [Anisodus tanguticus]